jgi:exodeoxyribonuclease V alpha subunit
MRGLTDATRVDHLPAAAAALAPYVEAGIFDAYEVHLVAAIARLDPGSDDDVRLALALAGRSPRFGHVCTRLDVAELPLAMAEADEPSAVSLRWPAPESWERSLRRSSLVADAESGERRPLRPLVWDLGRLYLQRLWHDELQVASELRLRCTGGGESPSVGTSELDDASIESTLGSLFGWSRRRQGSDGPVPDGSRTDRQRLATRRGLRHRVSIIAGGPGTGKTYTVARLLAATHLAADRSGRRLSVALAAPTGKAANRMSEAVALAVGALAADDIVDDALAQELVETPALTLHRLLGARGDATYFHDRHHPLPYDLVIVDETSMVSLSLLAALVVALRPEARLVLVGDPSQLTSIEAGTVMSDLVGPYQEGAGEEVAAGQGGADRGAVDEGASGGNASAIGVLSGRVTVLDRVQRYAEDSGIAALAGAIRRGEVADTIDILASGASDVRWIRHDDVTGLEAVRGEVVGDGVAMVAAARSGDAAASLELAGRSKVLCAVRRGPAGRSAWGDVIRSAVLGQTSARRRRWYVGRPIMVTANDAINRLFNGDVGVVVDHDGRTQVAMREGQGIRWLAPAQFDQVDEWWAMTIHKSQGSEFTHAVIVLPEVGSPILSRELLYTGVTRARTRLTVVGDEDAVRAAVGRPVARASGLAERLWGMQRSAR